MTDTFISLGRSLDLVIRNAIRKELDSMHHGLMNQTELLAYLGITKHDLEIFINDGLLREGIHWFCIEIHGKKSNKKKYIPDKCLQAIVEHHTVSV